MSKLILNQNGVRRKIDFSSPTPLSTVLDMLPHPCGGKGFCGKCRVRIMGKISAPTAAERTMLSREQLRDGVRLACQVTLNGDAQVTVADTAAPAKATSSDVPRKKPLGEKYGLSIDLGTTTICAAVFDLQTGKRCTEGSAANPQARYGADVLSRVESAIQGNGNELSRCIRHALFDLCAQVMMTAKLAPGDVDAAVLVGNTAMLYLLFGLDPTGISTSPFQCDTLFGDFYPADFLPVRRGTKVFVPRCISAFLGADAAAAALACGLHRPGDRMVADLGTNGEILLRSGNELLGCSCAAGPAFEGVGLSCGSPAVDGAVRSVLLSGGRTVYETVNGTSPTGICGSGYTDWFACLRKTGELKKDGTLCADRVYLGDTPLYLSQKDVRAFQLAKSAVRTGMEYLLRSSLDAAPGSLDIAGSFGSALSMRSAVAIGLIPPQLTPVARAVGNAAATGAAMVLLDDSLTQTAYDLASSTKTIPLADQPDFSDRLCDNLTLE